MTPGMFQVVSAPGPLAQCHPPQARCTLWALRSGCGPGGQPSPEEQAGETGVTVERLGDPVASGSALGSNFFGSGRALRGVSGTQHPKAPNSLYLLVNLQ